MIPISAVLFDLHTTLVAPARPGPWLNRALEISGISVDDARRAELTEFLRRIWQLAHDVDPLAERDTSATRHREVYEELIRLGPPIEPELADAIYDSEIEDWVPYEDTAPTLAALHAAGIQTAIVSNVGIDIRPLLRMRGLSEAVDVVILSSELGVAKPNPAIFRAALDALGTGPENALMVGDNHGTDGAAARLGIRVLILPDNRTMVHGLEAVTRLVGLG